MTNKKCRYTPFNLDALEKIACDSVGASQCDSWKKIGEGSFNKIFLLSFDNDTQVVVRIPCPLVGNVEQTIASEVATMCYVRERWMRHRSKYMPLPPKVIAWNSTYRNRAETPYIILEYAQGVPLIERWWQIEGKSAGAALQSIADLELSLLHDPFCQHGSLYFADDVSDELRNHALYDLPSELNMSTELGRQLSAKYRIGPTVNREWWRGEYARVEANRGPWKDMQTMIVSAAEFQLRAIDMVNFASPYIKSRASTIPLLRRLLQICIRVASLLAPHDSELIRPALNHPDLTLTNLIVPKEGWACVTHAIDWQHAVIAPFVMAAGFPPAVQYRQGLIPIPDDGSRPPLPQDFDELPSEVQQLLRVHHRYACRHRLYKMLVPERDFLREQAWSLPHGNALANLTAHITRCIADGPSDLRGYLIDLQQKWESFSDESCPIDFTAEEIDAHAVEEQAQLEYTNNVSDLYDELCCMDDGSVKVEHYETAKKEAEVRRANWDASAMKGPFPFYEGAHSWFLT